MKYQVAFFCPDDHLAYNLHTLDRVGAGGGVTARIRMAHALAAAGHAVTAYVNCPRDETINGVHYRNFRRVDRIAADVLIAGTSGGDLDLSPLSRVLVTTKLRLLMVHGVDPPRGIELESFDFVYALSNFVRGLVAGPWGVEPGRIFVTQRGVMDEFYAAGSRAPRRDPFAIAYAGHPSKGLSAAIEVLRSLRRTEPRFTLHVFGGGQLWGEPEQPPPQASGLHYHGLLGQSSLARRLQECGFSLSLQTREEPFGMVVIEALRAGCIVLASSVGSYPELIRSGHSGFLMPGNPAETVVLEHTAQILRSLADNPDYSRFIRRNAVVYPLDWSVIARAWTAHWDWVLAGSQLQPQPGLEPCPACGGTWLPLADGLHCTGCGNYVRDPNS